MRLSLRAIVLTALVPLSGCAPGTIVAIVDPACAAIRHVCTSKDDRMTEGTARQVEGNNLAREKLCKRADPCQQPPARAEPKTS